jgi:hypothetical protein
MLGRESTRVAQLENRAMQSLILLSVVFAFFVVPWYCAKDPDPQRGLRRMVLGLFGYTAFYVILILYLLPYLGV